jgi:phosphate acyltransferase
VSESTPRATHRIAVDAMGGDHGPRPIIDGALAAARHVGVGLLFAGPREIVERELARHPDAASLDIAIVDAPEVIGMAEPPAQALRRKPRASIRLAADAVADGRAVALVSAGSTGASVMAAYGRFGLLAAADRPALAAMGAVYARVALGIPHPRVGLSSIGEEETKGTDVIREAHRLLEGGALNFIGNVEGRDVYSGTADVVVCDGFTGNVALKISEGLVDAVEHLLGQELQSTFSTRVGYLLSLRAFRRFGTRVVYSEYGGAPLLGVNGLCIVGHGRSSARAVRNAVAMAHRFAVQQVVEKLEAGIAAVTVPHP